MTSQNRACRDRNRGMSMPTNGCGRRAAKRRRLFSLALDGLAPLAFAPAIGFRAGRIWPSVAMTLARRTPGRSPFSPSQIVGAFPQATIATAMLQGVNFAGSRAWFLLPLPQPYTWSAAVLVDELPTPASCKGIARPHRRRHLSFLFGRLGGFAPDLLCGNRGF